MWPGFKLPTTVGAGQPDDPYRVPTFQDAQDLVREFMLDAPEGLKALVYQTLHAGGLRIYDCPKRVAQYRDSFVSS